jgi:hypothetical protein
MARRVGDYWRLVGTVYIQGVMDGEEWLEDEALLVELILV